MQLTQTQYTYLTPITFTTPHGKISYTTLNDTAELSTSILILLGTFHTSEFLTLFQTIAAEFPHVRLIMVDRFSCPVEAGVDPLLRNSDLLLGLLTHLNVAHVNIMFHSAGAYAALDFSARYPHITRELFAVCAVIPPHCTNSFMLNVAASRIMPDICFIPVLFVLSIFWESYHEVNKSFSRCFNYLKSRFARMIGYSHPDSLPLLKDTPSSKGEISESPLQEFFFDQLDQRITLENRPILTDAFKTDIYLCAARLPTVPASRQLGLYKNSTHPLTWFTSPEDSVYNTYDVVKFSALIRRQVNIKKLVNSDHRSAFLSREVFETVIDACSRDRNKN